MYRITRAHRSSIIGIPNRSVWCRAGMWTFLLALSALTPQSRSITADLEAWDHYPHFEIGVVTMGPATENSPIFLDCAESTSLNVTINATETTVVPGDVFHFYRQVVKLTESHRLDTILIDQDLTTASIVHAVIDSTSYGQVMDRVLMIKGDRNMDKNWCHFAEYFHLGDAISGEETTASIAVSDRKSVALPHGEVVPLDQWVLLFQKRADAILTLAEAAGWNQFLLLFDDEFEAQARELLLLTSENRHNDLTLRLTSLRNWASLRDNILQYFETSTDFNFILLSTIPRAEEVLHMVNTLEDEIGKRILVSGRSNWLLISQGGSVHPGLWIFQSRFDNVAILSNPEDVLSLHDEEGELGESVQVVTTLLYKTAQRELAVVGRLDHTWTFHKQSDIFPNIKFGFNGRQFIVTTNMWDPYVYRHTNSKGEYVYTGFCIDLAYELARTLNFTVEFTEPPDGGWGADIGNGSWSGMVGQIVREEVDVIIAPIGVTMAREQVIDFTFAFFYDDSAVILKKPDPDESKWRTYIDIFRIEVLYCIFLALGLSAALLTGLEYIIKRIHVFHEPGEKVFAKTYLGSLLYLFGAMFNQGGQNLPYSATGRVFISSWWLFCLVVAGTFGGNLIAVLTVTKDKPPFNTLAEMAGQSDYIFGTLGNSMWTTLFENKLLKKGMLPRSGLYFWVPDSPACKESHRMTSPRPEFQAISRKMEAFYTDDPSVYSYDPNVHLRRVKRGGYAYIADNGMFTNWLAYNCDLMILKEKFFPAKYAIGLPNHSAYTKLFSEQVVKVYESGLLQVWVKKWWPSRSFCAGSLVTEARNLNLKDVQSAFYLLSVGAIFAATLLLSEVAVPILKSLVPASLRDIKVVPESIKKAISKESLTKEKSGLRFKSWW